MDRVEAMARAMCEEALVDPDAMTFPGQVPHCDVGNERFSFMPTGFQKDDITPAWMRWVRPAKCALAAIEKTDKDICATIEE